MENFNIYNPTNLHFGKDVINNLPEAAKKYGKNVLLIYGKGSVVKYGYYQKLINLMYENNFNVFEYSGIKPNPVIEDVEKAVKKAIKNNIDFIIAIGGGSVIDTAKAVAVCIPENLNPWEVVKYKSVPEKSLPVIVVLTLAATGTEMNPYAVIQNHKTNEKLGFGYPMMFPKHSFVDPTYTFTVPPDYTAYGVADIIAHAFENFFGKGNSPLADRFAVSIVKETMHYAPLVLEEPGNYEYRANILLQSTAALNGITSYGKTGGDWGVHSLGHILSLLYDMPHGASLSVAYPAWFKLMKEKIPERIKRLSKLLFGYEDIEKFIKDIEEFFLSINCPVSLKPEGFDAAEKDEIISVMKQNKVSGFNYEINENEIVKIVDLMFE